MSTVGSVGKKTRHDFWSRLSARERILVMGLLAVALAMSAALLLTFRKRKLDALAQETSDLKAAIALVRADGGNFRRALAEQEKKSASLTNQELSFGALLDRAQQEVGISPSNQDEPMPQLVSEDIERKNLNISLRSVSMSQATRFLQVMEETQTHPVRTQMISLRANDPAEDIVNIDVEVAGWRRKVARASVDPDAAAGGLSAAAPVMSEEGKP